MPCPCIPSSYICMSCLLHILFPFPTLCIASFPCSVRCNVLFPHPVSAINSYHFLSLPNPFPCMPYLLQSSSSAFSRHCQFVSWRTEQIVKSTENAILQHSSALSPDCRTTSSVIFMFHVCLCLPASLSSCLFLSSPCIIQSFHLSLSLCSSHNVSLYLSNYVCLFVYFSVRLLSIFTACLPLPRPHLAILSD